MALDFVMSRAMMIVAGLLIAGAAAGTYSFFTGIPEAKEFDAFTRAWTQPFQEAATGTGDAAATLRFGSDFGVGVLPVVFKGDPLNVTIYRDAIILEAGARERRVPFLAAQRTHLWYATNAREYTSADERVLDNRITHWPVDFGNAVRVVRGPNAEGALQVYVAQVAWVVEPAVCRFDVDETGSIDHKECPDVFFGHARADGSAIAGASFALDHENRGTVAHKTTSATGQFSFWPEPGISDGRERLVVVDENGRTGMVLPVVTSYADTS